MPKKTRKAKVRASQRPIPMGTVAAPVAPAPLPSPRPTPARDSMSPHLAGPTASIAAARVPAAVTTDYGYVFRDLRRIGLLALLFFGIMLVLWFLVEVQGVHFIPGYF